MTWTVLNIFTQWLQKPHHGGYVKQYKENNQDLPRFTKMEKWICSGCIYNIDCLL
jgi:hypothetical protein